ncbi:type II secretion system protein [Bdellovibrio sp.]|uniref:type II secretion system protein n=1 Tax=Bdellovibrio sp. TaxID=28201 RepID=UPI0039E59815
MTSTLKNQKGITIIESLLGLAMITLVGSFFISGILSMKKVAKDSGTKNALYKQINDVIENIRPNVRMYQINYFQTDEERNNALALDTLPMAWGSGIMTTAEQCPDCPGRYGFVIQAYPGMSGLYLVTVRLSHKDWSKGSAQSQEAGANAYGFVDYQFVVNSQ